MPVSTSSRLVSELILSLLAGLSVLGAFLIPDAGSDFLILIGQETNGTPDLNHPAVRGVLWPFQQLPSSLAVQVWAILSLILYVWCAVRVARISKLSVGHVLIGLFALTGTAIALGLGQVTALLAVLMTLSWSAARDGRSVTAGICMGVLCALKPFYGLFLVAYVVQRDWSALVSALASGLAVMLLGLLVGGVDSYRLWLTHLGSVTWHAHLFNGSVWGLGARWFEWTSVTWAAKWTPVVVSPAASVTLSSMGVSAILFALWRARQATPDRTYALVGLACLLVSPLGWIYYLPALIGPLVMVIRPSWGWGLVLALAVVPYPLLVNRHYDVIGTLIVGLWPVVVLVGAFGLTLTSERAGH